MREDGTGLTLLSESVGDYTWTDNGIAYDSSPAISPDGTRLLYATKRYPYELFHIATTTLEEQERVLGLFGGGREHRRLRPGREWQTAPAWSPDGTRIAFLLDGNLHTMAADGSDPRSIAPGISGIYEPPAWSPDGTRLAFRGSARSWREVSLYVVDADGSNLTLVADGAEGAPAWSPDGTRIAFLQDGALDVLYIFELDGALTSAELGTKLARRRCTACVLGRSRCSRPAATGLQSSPADRGRTRDSPGDPSWDCQRSRLRGHLMKRDSPFGPGRLPPPYSCLAPLRTPNTPTSCS